MDDRGVDGRAAAADHHEAHGQRRVADGEQDEHDARGHERLAEPNHGLVVKAQGEKAARRPACGDAEVEEGRPTGRLAGGDAAGKRAVARRPHAAARLERAVAEEADEHLAHAGKPQKLAPRGRREGLAVLAGMGGCFRPELAARGNEPDDDKLDDADGEKAQVPGAPREAGGHDERPRARSDAPHAVEPAHVARGVVNRDVRVECGVDGARPEAVGNCPEADLPERAHGREAHKSQCGECDASDDGPKDAETLDQAHGEKARDDGTRADDERDDALPRHACPELDVHGRPGGADGRVGKAEAHEGDVDDGEKQAHD